MFDLPEHPASRAYAWSHEGNGGGRRYVAVLHAPPINSPRSAVQAALVAEFKEKQSRD